MKTEIALSYSGGTDSTCAAALVAERFDVVHLLTYKRLGLFQTDNSKLNVAKLKKKYGEDKITHRIIKLNKLYDYVSDERFLHYVFRYGFFNLSGCGVCKLAIHIRTLLWCLENDIKHACDGSTRDLYLFPTQIEKINNEIKKMYSHFGVTYETPVYDLDPPDNVDLWDKMRISDKNYLSPHRESNPDGPGMTTGKKLFEMGLMPEENVKGSPLDFRMQSRCFQFILFNTYLLWVYFPSHSYEEFEERVVKLYREKIDHFTTLIDEYLHDRKKNKLAGLLEY